MSNPRSDRVKLSSAAKQMMNRIRVAEASDQMLPFNKVDFRVYPKLSRLGLVAANIYRPHEGVCFTPAGRLLLENEK